MNNPGQSCFRAESTGSLVEAELSSSAAATTNRAGRESGSREDSALSELRVEEGLASDSGNAAAARPRLPRATRVAVISFLFNWPSTGGGNMHTAGLVEFLGATGMKCATFYARFPGWDIGLVTDDGLNASEAIEFAESGWNIQTIGQRFRAVLDS